MDNLNIRSYTREAEKEVEETAALYSPEDAMSNEDKRDMRKDIVRQRVAEATASIAETLNGGNQEDVVAGMMEGLRRTHRYIQSEFWKGMIEMIKQTSELDSAVNFDGRNEWTKAWCERMHKAGWEITS